MDKKHTHTQINKISQFPSTIFYLFILKLLYDSFIINVVNYIFSKV